MGQLSKIIRLRLLEIIIVIVVIQIQRTDDAPAETPLER